MFYIIGAIRTYFNYIVLKSIQNLNTQYKLSIENHRKKLYKSEYIYVQFLLKKNFSKCTNYECFYLFNNFQFFKQCKIYKRNSVFRLKSKITILQGCQRFLRNLFQLFRRTSFWVYFQNKNKFKVKSVLNSITILKRYCKAT